ncbi:hypothetical protein RFI_29168 [Reticulomyxa filosa]|uniref:Uncharacterized protein n=1 Tax=Reticulomyxa filosa TaxID=46433 RepID=X6M2R4_RETFI|nr:hypothetical protein RFI_29168 [Reticulomyxa filosa]|eukprot:ETO08219.1 hypothetical protein RFI_29168 [Reticulomyxa filosa]
MFEEDCKDRVESWQCANIKSHLSKLASSFDITVSTIQLLVHHNTRYTRLLLNNASDIAATIESLRCHVSSVDVTTDYENQSKKGKKSGIEELTRSNGGKAQNVLLMYPTCKSAELSFAEYCNEQLLDRWLISMYISGEQISANDFRCFVRKDVKNISSTAMYHNPLWNATQYEQHRLQIVRHACTPSQPQQWDQIHTDVRPNDVHGRSTAIVFSWLYSGALVWVVALALAQ